jgi:tryptophanase
MTEVAIKPPTTSVFVTRAVVAASPEDREAILRSVGYNIFAFPAALTTVDLLSDSGTSAMTDIQWAAMFRGDESYGRNTGYFCFLEAFRDVFERGEERKHAFRDILGTPATSQLLEKQYLTPFEGGFVNGGDAQMLRPNFFILPQGRCAESILFSTLRKRVAQQGIELQPVILSNGFFDTTTANASCAGFELQTFCHPVFHEQFSSEGLRKRNSFGGNLDIDACSEFLSENTGRVSMILLTVTNNSAAGQPVSMANIKASSRLSSQFQIPIFFDACRFAENAIFIKDFEPGYQAMPITEIIKEMFSYVDGFTISLKKDGLSNIGGALCFRDKGMFAQKYAGIGNDFKEQQIMSYGNDSYGGMSGRDMMAATVGLYEATNDMYLASRVEQVRRFAQKLHDAQVPVLLPTGGSAVFLDMDEFFKDCGRSYGEFAALGFTLQLLISHGVRCFEVGPFALEWDRADEDKRSKMKNLVRLALPRQAMTDEHLDYTVAAIKQLFNERSKIPGVRIVSGASLNLRHFQCTLEPIPQRD